MGNRKDNLISYPIIGGSSSVSGDMSQATITSLVTNINHIRTVGIQLSWIGSPVGTFTVQVSIDYAQDSLGNVTNSGTWTPIALSPAATTVSGSPIYIDLTATSAPWIRTVYTKGSGSGTLKAFISGKY